MSGPNYCVSLVTGCSSDYACSFACWLALSVCDQNCCVSLVADHSSDYACSFVCWLAPSVCGQNCCVSLVADRSSDYACSFVCWLAPSVSKPLPHTTQPHCSHHPPNVIRRAPALSASFLLPRPRSMIPALFSQTRQRAAVLYMLFDKFKTRLSIDSS